MSDRKKSHLLGLGLDSDGEKRITQAERFTLVGGTEETHEAMTETVIKTFEDLKRRMAEGSGNCRQHCDNERDPPFYAFLFFHVV